MHELMILCNYIHVLENCNKKNAVSCALFPLYGVPIAVKTITDVIPKSVLIFKNTEHYIVGTYNILIYIRTWLRILK